MWRTLLMAWAGVLALVAGGCYSGPLLENPLPLPLGPEPSVTVENPVFLPLGPPDYNLVYEKVMDILTTSGFEISEDNRYGGILKTFPRIAPGFERSLIAGNPDLEQRWYATLQTIRHYAIAKIQIADDGGFFVSVQVWRELEDIPKPVRATAGLAAFRSDNTVDRQMEVIDATFTESNWIPIGRDLKFEQVILQQIKWISRSGQAGPTP